MKNLILFVMLALVLTGCRNRKPIVPVMDLPTEAAIIEYTNQSRTNNGLSPLKKNDVIVDAARKYAAVMAQSQNLSHYIGGSVGDRLHKEGYNWSVCGENIAFGYSDALAVIEGWLSSSGHRKNIMNPDFNEIGVGVAYDEDGKPYYCQIFGKK